MWPLVFSKDDFGSASCLGHQRRRANERLTMSFPAVSLMKQPVRASARYPQPVNHCKMRLSSSLNAPDATHGPAMISPGRLFQVNFWPWPEDSIVHSPDVCHTLQGMMEPQGRFRAGSVSLCAPGKPPGRAQVSACRSGVTLTHSTPAPETQTHVRQLIQARKPSPSSSSLQWRQNLPFLDPSWR